MIFYKPNYENMNPDEFQKESIKLFEIRKELEHAIMVIKAFEEISINDVSDERKKVIFEEYTIHKTIDISSYEPSKKTISISTNPVILKNGNIAISASLNINNKPIRERDILLELRYLRKNLLIHMIQMRRHYKQMRKTKNWPDIYRR